MGKKVKQWIFQKLLSSMISKLVDAINQLSMNIKGQDHSLTFVQGHSDSTFSNFFSLETPRPIEAKFCGASMGWGNESEYSWFMMAAMSIYGKTL